MSKKKGSQNENTSKDVHHQREARKAAHKRYCGVVRAVPSGDSVVLYDPEEKTGGKAYTEINFSFMGVKAPSLPRKKGPDAKEEDYAFQSREFLRNKVIGKSVLYRKQMDYGNRVYGELWLKGEDIRESVVAAGWAKPNKSDREEDQEIIKLGLLAEKKKLGVYSNAGGAVRNVKYYESSRDGNNDALISFLNKNKGRTLQGVVENVRSGSTVSVYVPSARAEVTLDLSGVKSPMIKYSDLAESEPYSYEAKFFTEQCYLHRDVIAVLEGMDINNNIYGSVLERAEKKNVAEYLIKMGLAIFVKWTAPEDECKKWIALEAAAKAQKLRIWDHKRAETSFQQAAPKDVEVQSGKVIEVVNSNTIIIELNTGKGPKELKIKLSSVQVPRLPQIEKNEKNNNKKAADKKEEQQLKLISPEEKARREKALEKETDTKRKEYEEKWRSGFAVQGKEWLRSKLIGKRVNFVLDYRRSHDDTKSKDGRKPAPPTPFYSVYLNNKNIAISLVEEGFANVTNHRAEEARSAEYKDLLNADRVAQTAKRGLHSLKTNSPIYQINDVAFDAKNAKFYLSALTRHEEISAVVQYVFAANRMKLYVPKEQLLISFSLKGVQTVDKVMKVNVKNQSGDIPFSQLYPSKVVDSDGEEARTCYANVALQYTRGKLFQRDVKINVSSLDTYGNFIGTMSVQGRDYSMELISESLCKVNHYSAKQLGDATYKKYKLAEESAQDLKKSGCIWERYDKQAEELKRKEQKDATSKVPEKRQEKVRVTEIMTGTTFFFQRADSESTKVFEDMMKDLATQDFQSKPLHKPNKKGEWVICQFSADNEWYRAEILGIYGGKNNQQGNPEPLEYEVRYVDYGNTEVVRGDTIRSLPSDFSAANTPAQAYRGKLAYITAPELSKEHGRDSAACFKELVWDNVMVSNIQFTEGQGGKDTIYNVVLGIPTEGNKVIVNESLVDEGLAYMEKQRGIFNEDIYKALVASCEKAKKAHKNIWEYGDSSEYGDSEWR